MVSIVAGKPPKRLIDKEYSRMKSSVKIDFRVKVKMTLSDMEKRMIKQEFSKTMRAAEKFML